jgi:hypothetical protein
MNDRPKIRPHVNPQIVGMIAPAAWAAVAKAMEHLHATNPAGYHAQRPSQKRCPFPPKLVGVAVPSDDEIADALDSDGEIDLDGAPIRERCPFVKT